jgi:hypothetical protein
MGRVTARWNSCANPLASPRTAGIISNPSEGSLWNNTVLHPVETRTGAASGFPAPIRAGGSAITNANCNHHAASSCCRQKWRDFHALRVKISRMMSLPEIRPSVLLGFSRKIPIGISDAKVSYNGSGVCDSDDIDGSSSNRTIKKQKSIML